MKTISNNVTLNMKTIYADTGMVYSEGETAKTTLVSNENMNLKKFIIHMCVQLPELKYASIHKVKLRFRQHNSTPAETMFVTASERYLYSTEGKVMDLITENGVMYREVDITWAFNASNERYFAIICPDNEVSLYTDSSSYKPLLTIEYLEDGESTINQKYIEGNAGRSLNYAINVRSGRPTFTKALIQNNTTVLPIELGLYFNPLNKNVSELSMPNGWNFTYNQKVYIEMLEYKYIDGSGLLHVFEKAYNSNTVYFDKSGSGLMLTVGDVNYIISDGYGNNLYFDRGTGWLSKVEKVQGSNSFNTIMYRDSTTNQLRGIYEENTVNGSTGGVSFDVSIIYNSDNTIKIQSTGGPDIILTKDSSGKLISIKEEDERVSTYTYTNGMILTATSDNGENSVFSYDQKERVESIIDYANSTSNILNKLTFAYGYFNTYVTNYFGVKKGYTFDEEGLLIGEYEETGNKYGKVKYVEKTDESIKGDTNQSEKYLTYADFSVNGSTGTGSASIASVEGDLDLNFSDYYKLNFIYKVDEIFTNVNSESIIKVSQGRVDLASKALDLRRTTDTPCGLIFQIEEHEPITISVQHNNEDGSTVYIKNISITKVTKECTMCTNLEFNNNAKFEANDIDFYPFNKANFKYNGSSTNNGYMYYDDLVENSKNIALNSTTHNIWYNKKRGLLVNVSNVTIERQGTYISLTNLKCGTAILDDKQIQIDYTDYQNDGTITNQLCKMTRSVSVSNNDPIITSTEYMNKFFQVIKQIEFKREGCSIQTTYTFDDYGKVTKEEIADSNNVKKNIIEYTYDGMILESKTVYINGQASTTTYTSNTSTGLVESITYPDESVEEIEYVDKTNGKFKSISQTVNSTLNTNELTYQKDKVTNYKGMNNGLTVEYDGYNKISKLKNHDKTIWCINRTITTSQVYENIWYGSSTGFNVKNIYDIYGNLILRQESTGGITYTDKLKYFYSDLPADEITTTSPTDSSLKKSISSKLRKVIDSEYTNTKNIFYNEVGNVRKETNTDTTHKPSKIESTYDINNRLISKKYNDGTRVEGAEYSLDFGEDISKFTSSLVQNVYGTNKTINSNVVYEKDSFNRVTKETIITVDSKKLSREFTYVDDNNKATNLVKTIKLIKDSVLQDTLTYTYDLMGRIIKVQNTYSTIYTTYEYDKLGRLVRENNKELNKSFQFFYDGNGNITGKIEGPFTEGTSVYPASTNTFTYEQDYSDKLEKYNSQSVEVSSTGNITKIGSTTYTWVKENLLSRVYKSSYANSNYYYDGMGFRRQKVVYTNGTTVTHNYQYDGSRILKEVIVGGSYAGILEFIYLGNQITGFTYKNKQYFFQKNLQGDIIKIYDNTNTLVASYKYDAWGNHTITLDTNSIGTINPFRYRGYYYDRESNLYYCNARYYNPEILRWMSLDSLRYLEKDRINGCNLYTYCGDDPINLSDPSGHFPVFLAVLIISVVSNLLIELHEDYKEDKKFLGDKDGLDYLGAFASGVITSFGGGFLSSVGLGVVGDVVDSAINGDLWELDGSDEVLNFVGSSIFSNSLGCLIGDLAGLAGRKIASNIKANKFIKAKGILDNSVINKELRNITNNLNIGAKKATKKTIAKEIFSVNTWKPLKKVDEIVGEIAGDLAGFFF